MSYSAKNSPFGYKLIKDIVKECPRSPEIIERYFGEGCLERGGFGVKTLEIACILFSVDQNRLIQKFEKIQN